ncbi:MAG: hypothetical protein FD123_1446 [Bacteroidetes bacterium]|nr:MAG: hypothetical protein FD123_1446 [Bacteroidota bacterium]
MKHRNPGHGYKNRIRRNLAGRGKTTKSFKIWYFKTQAWLKFPLFALNLNFRFTTTISMKKIILSLAVIVCSGLLNAQTNPGDTIVMQTFTFGSPQDAWFVFPPDTNSYEKVIMKYTLKCNPAQNPACGEWDYLTNTYVYKPTGLLDSSQVIQPMLLVNGASADSAVYSNTPTYSYDTLWQYFIVHSSTTSLVSSVIGNGNTTTPAPFGASRPVSRTQYLWKASEMTAAGMNAGNITGMQFFLQTLGGQLRNMTIRMQHTVLDSLTQQTFTAGGFTDVYMQNTSFASGGWNSLQLTTPFNWDGTSNLLIEITYDGLQASADNVLAADTTQTFKSALLNAGNDRDVSAVSGGYVSIPLNAELAGIDSFVTVSFWTYGNAALQPMNGTSFEAVDSLGQRVINAHLPWSDSRIYWDAGNSGGSSYDRIDKAATTAEIEGQWIYWSFTKNVATGSMKIYKNGVLWHSGTNKTRYMNNIRTFRLLKGAGNGSLSYEGRMDEFTVFNKELSAPEILNYMNQPVTVTDSNFTRLVLRYDFNDGNYITVSDSAAGNHPAATLASVQNALKPASELVSNFTESKIRPRVTFEQGVYTSYIDSLQVLDSTMNVPMQILVFNDSVVNPGIATDTIIGWPATSGMNSDSTIYFSQYDYYNTFPEVIRYELARYITPYGNGLSLGAGWTWTFDVSDYVTLLHDSVHLAAGNWQELLDVKFLMILGTPPRPVLGIENLYNGNFNYGIGSDPIDNYLPP